MDAKTCDLSPIKPDMQCKRRYSEAEMKNGYFLDYDWSPLDNSFFSPTKNELEKTDPQQRL